MPDKNKSTTHLEDLMIALNITGVDLEANQAGTMSVRQQQRVRRQFGVNQVMVCFFVVLIAIPMCGILFSIVGNPALQDTTQDLSVLCALSPLWLMPLLTLMWGIRTSWRLWENRSDNIGVVEGRIRLSLTATSSELSHQHNPKLYINHTTFSISRRLHQTLNNGGTYRIYFAWQENTILSVEPLAMDSK